MGYEAEVTVDGSRPPPPEGVSECGTSTPEEAIGMPTRRQARGDDQGRLLDQGSSR